MGEVADCTECGETFPKKYLLYLKGGSKLCELCQLLVAMAPNAAQIEENQAELKRLKHKVAEECRGPGIPWPPKPSLDPGPCDEGV